MLYYIFGQYGLNELFDFRRILYLDVRTRPGADLFVIRIRIRIKHPDPEQPYQHIRIRIRQTDPEPDPLPVFQVKSERERCCCVFSQLHTDRRRRENTLV